jgi:hypothetical protein
MEKEVEKKFKFVLSDTTVQKSNTTVPIETKICEKIINKCTTGYVIQFLLSLLKRNGMNKTEK